jgi:hypothetical protein
MLKFLIFVFLFFAVIYYVLIVPFRPRQQVRHDQNEAKKKKVGNVNIDYVPDDNKNAKSGHIKGGDYIDYEEVNE